MALRLNSNTLSQQNKPKLADSHFDGDRIRHIIEELFISLNKNGSTISDRSIDSVFAIFNNILGAPYID